MITSGFCEQWHPSLLALILCFCFHLLGRYYKIVSSSENYAAILSKLREEGVNFETDNGSELIPITTVEVYLIMVQADTNQPQSSMLCTAHKSFIC